MYGWFWIAVVFLVVFASRATGEELAGMSEAAVILRQEFSRLDANHDFQLDLEEFSSLGGDARVRQRDFWLFDFDGSGRLSRDEFSCVSGIVAAPFRGTMPDPVDQLVDDAVAALDESYDYWNRRPEELVSAHAFVSNFLESISPGEKRFVTGRIIGQADQNSDGRISRNEAKHFLEQQLGIRLQHGPPLREPTGRLVRYDRFLVMDADRNASLSRQEFLDGWGNDAAAQTFPRIDRDANDRITYEEYAHPLSKAFFDPIEWFRQSDGDLDARLNEEELFLAVAQERRHLVGSTLNSFDDDQDGLLSLREYRSSMLASYNYPWDRQPIDRDRDGQLSFDEFVFDASDLFHLQRWYYFQRFDLDRDGSLSPDEFEFPLRSPVSIWAVSASGAESRMLYQNRQFPDCGWPSVSPDGTQLLFHQCPRSGPSDGQIVLISLEGDHTRIICDGVRPSWSSDGASFVCERRSRDAGIWIMDAGGRSGRRVSAGHGPKWSPDGKSIAFLNNNGVSVFDVASGEIREVFRREEHPYQDLGSDLVWAPDSRRLAFVGNFAASSQLLILPIPVSRVTQPRIRYSFDVPFRENLNWDKQLGIVLGVRDIESGETTLSSFDPDANDGPRRPELFVEISGARSACVTPDRKWYITVIDE